MGFGCSALFVSSRPTQGVRPLAYAMTGTSAEVVDVRVGATACIKDQSGGPLSPDSQACGGPHAACQRLRLPA